jgi:hypothetical protein
MHVDNSNIESKVALRRYFLDKYHKEGEVNVLDCFAGHGHVWGRLKSEYKLNSYVGLDKKDIKGVLPIDNLRVLSDGQVWYNVVDLDAYGEPWRQWDILLRRIKSPTTVFLTIGAAHIGVSKFMRKLAGVPERCPSALCVKMRQTMTGIAFSLPMSYNIDIVEAAEATAAMHARYVGFRLSPRSGLSDGKHNHSLDRLHA